MLFQLTQKIMLNRKIRYFRQIVPQVFFWARASILKWKMLVSVWVARGSDHLNMQQSQRLVKVRFWWLLATKIRKATRSSQTKCGAVGKSNFNGGAMCPAADRYRCPNSTWSPHAPVTHNINLLSPGCLFYPDLNSTLFLWRFDSEYCEKQ